jgi:hypothetical protein
VEELFFYLQIGKIIKPRGYLPSLRFIKEEIVLRNIRNAVSCCPDFLFKFPDENLVSLRPDIVQAPMRRSAKTQIRRNRNRDSGAIKV